jgi:hypothetical protein
MSDFLISPNKASSIDGSVEKYEVADIFKVYGERYLETHNMPYSHQEIMKDIITCRTEFLGGHQQKCDSCETEWYTWNSCGNRHCPKCQAMKKEEWLQERKRELLPVPYFHNIFTLPHEINPIALYNQDVIYKMLFDSTAETLQEFGKNELHGKLGFICTLHTWDQKMLYHLHLHCIIPGALSFEGDKWNSSKPDYLFDVTKLSKRFREIFVKKLEKSYKKKELIFEGEILQLGTQKGFEELTSTLLSKDWVVYSKKPVTAEVVLDYLGRYVHRVAISNNRIVKVENDRVTFLYRDHSDGKLKPITVDADEFIRRFFLHALPDNFYRIRYYGFLSTKTRTTDLPKCREALGISKELPALEEISVKQFMLDYAGIDISKCPYCQTGNVKKIGEIEKVSNFALNDVFHFAIWDP